MYVHTDLLKKSTLGAPDKYPPKGHPNICLYIYVYVYMGAKYIAVGSLIAGLFDRVLVQVQGDFFPFVSAYIYWRTRMYMHMYVRTDLLEKDTLDSLICAYPYIRVCVYEGENYVHWGHFCSGFSEDISPVRQRCFS